MYVSNRSSVDRQTVFRNILKWGSYEAPRYIFREALAFFLRVLGNIEWKETGADRANPHIWQTDIHTNVRSNLLGSRRHILDVWRWTILKNAVYIVYDTYLHFFMLDVSETGTCVSDATLSRRERLTQRTQTMLSCRSALNLCLLHQFVFSKFIYFH